MKDLNNPHEYPEPITILGMAEETIERLEQKMTYYIEEIVKELNVTYEVEYDSDDVEKIIQSDFYTDE